MGRNARRPGAAPKSTATPSDTSKYAGLTLPVLRKTREEQVEKLNFEEVAVIDAAIRLLDFDNTQQLIETLTSELFETIEKASSLYEQGVNRQGLIAAESSQSVRTETHNRFSEAQARHLSEIANLEDARALDVALQWQRRSARGLELEKVAKGFARTEMVQRAIETRDEARRTEKAEHEAREQAVRDSYDMKLEALLEQLAVELSQLQNLLEQRLEGIELKKVAMIDLLKKTAVSTVREELRKKIASAHVQLHKKDKAGEVADVLTTKTREKVEADGCTVLLESTNR